MVYVIDLPVGRYASQPFGKWKYFIKLWRNDLLTIPVYVAPVVADQYGS